MKKTVGLGVTEITVWSAAAYPLGSGKEEIAPLYYLLQLFRG